MPPRKLRDAAQTREALLVAAEAAFARQGYGGARIDAIARAAGVNKALIQYHFGGKGGLYSAVLLRSLQPAIDRMEELRHSSAPAPQRLDDFVRIFGELHLAQPRISIMVLREMLSGGEHLDDEGLPHFIRAFSSLAEILEQGARDGSLRAVPVFCAHLSILGALLFFFGSRPFRSRIAAAGKLPFADVPPEIFLEFYRELAVSALRAPALVPPAAQRKP